MDTGSEIRRWGLVRMDGPHDAVRRYKLGRLEEVALAWPAPDQEPRPRPRPVRLKPPAADAAPGAPPVARDEQAA